MAIILLEFSEFFSNLGFFFPTKKSLNFVTQIFLNFTKVGYFAEKKETLMLRHHHP